MPHPLLDCARTDERGDILLDSIGTIFAEFGPTTQDSGNHSYGVRVGDERYFVKTAGLPGDRQAPLAHAERVELLRNAVRLHASCRHPNLVPLLHTVESPDGPLLVFPWFDGELLYVPRERRADPASALQRFWSLPAATIGRCLDAIFDLHAALARAGWVAADFYDGCLLYDFAADRLGVIDLDTYHRGAFPNPRDRWFGSTRFMAPEEFRRGAVIDERTTVFTLGRAALVLLGEMDDRGERFGGPEACGAVVRKACAEDPAQRFESVAMFHQAWRAAWNGGT
jgi:serine/threonine-protein kinase